jgi:hypothetical protein
MTFRTSSKNNFMYCYSLKAKSKILQSILRISAAIFAIVFYVSVINFGETNAFFSDKATIEGSTFSAGYWIPEIHMSVEPAEPDGKKGFYKTTPCVTLSADIHGEEDGIDIFYEFSDDGNPIKGGEKYEEGKCVEIPDGDPTHFQAQAVNEENDDWKSEVISKDFKVKTGADEGDVVINELMWMGSFGDNDDEWIELRNTTDEDIDISNWRILGAGKGSGDRAHVQIPNGYTIEANGYFLITKKKWNKTEISLSKDLDKNEGMTNVEGMDLDDNSEKLTLEDKNRKVIDVAWKDGCHWPAGWHGIFLHMSMERDKKPDNGKDASSWHTCVDSKCNDKTYWDHEGFDFGTPGKENLSEDDLVDSIIASMEKKIEDEQNASLNKTEDSNNAPKENKSAPPAPAEIPETIPEPEPNIPPNPETEQEPINENSPTE